MERRPTSILAALAIFAQALTLIAPWVPGQDPDRIAGIRRLADQGDVDAQFTLGTIYSFSQIIYANGGRAGPESDPAEAAKWYRLAAGQGHAIAQNNLGSMYAYGRGVPQDDAEAVRWYRQAAEQGAAEAQYNLGLMHANGRGVPENDAEAVKWYRLAADQGLARAQHNLGLIYANGTGVPQDDVLAYAWLTLAGEQGNELASGNKDKLRTRMTANQIARAQELSATLFDRINFASEDPDAKTGVMHGSASERRQ